MTEGLQRQGIDRELLTRLAKADQPGVILRTTVLLAVYAATAVLALQPGVGWWAVLFSVFLGFVLSGFINAAHDCVHRSHLRSKRANRIAGAAWGTPILLNFTIYRHQHLTHHRYTGVAGDTEPGETYLTVVAYLHTLSGVPFWPGSFKRILKTWRDNFPASVNTEDRRLQARQDNWVIVGWLVAMVALTVAFPFPLLIAYWLPLVFSFPIVVLLSLPEHYGLWGVPEVSRNTRTVQSNGFVRYFIWNANYHAEHHRFPAVASLNLHTLHKALPEPHPIQERSYLAFHVGLVKALARGETDYGKRREP